MKLNNTKLKMALLASTVFLVPTHAFAQENPDQEEDREQAARFALQGLDVEEITVIGRYIPDEKRATSEISNILDAEAFTLAGDGDVGSALQRLPGLSLVGGKYVYVRGLGERYSATLLNNSGIPSTEPLRKVVPLDIFPTAIIQDVLVQKTYSATYPAEFAGGVIDIRTKKVPDDFVLEIGISGKYNSEATGKTGLSYDGSNSEIFGFGGSLRTIPSEILQDVTLESLTPDQLEAAGEAIPNIFSIDNESLYPGLGFNAIYGDRFEVGDEGAFGFFAAVDYDVNTRNRVGVRRDFNVDNSGPVENFNFAPEICDRTGFEGGGDDCGLRQTNLDVALNGILSLGYEFNSSHSINYTGTVLRQSTKRSLIEKGIFAAERDALRTRSTIDFIESQVWTNQLSGEHNVSLFGDSDTFQEAKIEWRANISRSDRDAPLRRNTVYEFDDVLGEFLILARPDGNVTSYSALDEETREFGLDIEQPSYIGDFAVDFAGGFTYAEKERSFGLVRYNFAIPSGASTDLRRLAPEIIFGPTNIDPNGIRLTEIFDASDFYDATFENIQAYFSADIEISEKARLSLGLRYEDSEQIVNTVDRTTLDPIQVTQLGEFLLPAATFTYEIIENMQVRLAYSQTITRPDLRELSVAPFIDDERNITVRGNPTLRITEINNYDARFEWYFDAGESLTVGAFYKEFSNPIEQSVTAFGEGRLITYINGQSAELKGVEVEVEKILFLQDWFDWNWLGTREVFMKANASYIDGETITAEADLGIVTNAVRAFQGQSEYLANFQIGWRDYDRGENLAFVLNYTGRRLSLLGVFGAPDEFESPPILLNFAYSKEFEVGGRPLTVSFEADNILNDSIRFTQAGLVTEGYDLGTTLSLGFKYSF
ncbi:TonB-dependent receptor domain-containing protein [Kordiimonas aquimaris]|uniref:TonB-dependent receptor domain-containing protein n=1 Tax=Kordiimonas aquimaris TaxID=707591 RepID=UPI0021D3B49F|nr:TonB-dependent receptor [Kordiimonas aquimaris]